MVDRAEAPLSTLLDEALEALASGDTSSAVELATEVLRRDPANPAAREVIHGADAAPGEMRRLAIMFVDIIGSTRLVGRLPTESYRRLVRRCHGECERAIVDHGGRVVQRMGDGVMALFGHPEAHEDDTARAVRAALALVRGVAAIGPDVEREFGESVDVRVAVHLGLVHLDLVNSEIYGLAPNLAARVQELAAPNTVSVTDAVVDLVGTLFEIEDRGLHDVKGFDEPVRHHMVVAELSQSARMTAPASAPYLSRPVELDATAASVGADRGDPEHAALVVRGEPGIGKTRTVLEALARTDEPARRVLWLVCTENERSNEFGAAASLLQLDPAVSAREGPSDRLERLERHLRELGLDLEVNVPLLAPLLGIAPEVGYAPAEADLAVLRERIMGALRAWIEKLASTTVVVAVDDLQWADDSTVELLSGLVRQRIPGVRIIATERTGSARLTGNAVSVIDLEPLPADDATRLAHAVAGGLEDKDLESILDRGQGNPLFVQELARTIGGPAHEVGPEAISQLEAGGTVVPRALYEPLVSRLYRQGTDVGLAQAAATIGRNFRLGTLHAVSDRSRILVERGLESLLYAGLVERDAARESYWFRHALIRDVAYDLMPDEQRESMHGRVADALRSDRDVGLQVGWSTIAGHLRSAHRSYDAAEAFELAAEEALERGALEPSYELLTAAIDLLASLEDSESLRLRLAQIRLRRGFLSVSQGGPADPRAAIDYEACLQLTRGHSTGTEFATTLVGLYSYYAAKGDLALADEMITRIRATGITDDPDVADESFATEGIVRWFQGRFIESERCFEISGAQVVDPSAAETELGRWQIPQDTVATTSLHAALALWQRGDASGFDEHTQRALRRAQGLRFPYGPFTTLYVLSYEVLVLHEMGRLDVARSEIDAGQGIVDAHQLSFWPIALGMARAINEAEHLIAAGEYDAGALAPLAGQIGAAATLYRMVGAEVIVPYVLTNQAKVLCRLGALAEADAALDEAVVVASGTGSNWYSAETQRVRAHVLQANEASKDEIRAALSQAATLARRQGSVPFEIRALIDLRTAGACAAGLDELLAMPGALLCAGVEASALS